MTMDSILVDLAWKSAIILGAALAATCLLRRRSASLRQAVLSAGVGVTLLAIAATPVLPRWSPIGRMQRLPANTVALQTTILDRSEARLSAALHPSSSGRDPISIAVFAIWLAGAIALSVRLSNGVARLRRLGRDAACVREAPLLDLFRSCALATGLTRSIRLVTSDRSAVPMGFGVLRPVIVIPETFTQWPPDQQRMLLCHELAHVRSHHCAIRILAEMLCALLWFQPLAWLVRRELRLEQERACDDHVLAAAGRVSSYARLLMSWHERLLERAPQGAMLLIRRDGLEARLTAILDPRLDRARATARTIAVVWITAIGLALPLAALERKAGGALESTEERPGPIERILAALPGRDWRLTRQVESDLREIRDSGSLRSVTNAVCHPSGAVRERIAWILGQVGDPEAVPVLVTVLDDPDPRVRHNAAWALGTLGERAAIDPLLGRYRREPHADARAGIVWALGSIGGAAVIETLTAAGSDPSRDVREAAAWGLARQR